MAVDHEMCFASEILSQELAKSKLRFVGDISDQRVKILPTETPNHDGGCERRAFFVPKVRLIEIF